MQTKTYRSTRTLPKCYDEDIDDDDDSNDDSDDEDKSQEEIRSEGFHRMSKEHLLDSLSPISGSPEKSIRRKNRHDPDDNDADDDDDDDYDGRKSSKTQVDSSRKKKKPLIQQIRKSEPVKHNFFQWLFFIGLVIIFIAIIPYLSVALNAQNVESSVNKTNKEDVKLIMNNFRKNINDIRLIFKNQDDTIWNDIEGRIYEIIVNPKRPTVIFLFANDDQPMFCLARLLGNASRTVLNCEEDLLLTADDSILGDDYGMVIENLKDKIIQQRVVIFENILNINPEAMRAFHNLCDSENPLVRNAIYILTMVNNKNDNNYYKKTMNTRESMKFIEHQLTQKLTGNIDPDKLQPLVTRMTDAVIINVQSEPEFQSCPLRY
ncbi:uncharacterized protein LOC122854894 [Aphidius gifuensis]|nr:uncharacterized protein LOC122854894 [Aphidius gifuensis]